MKKITPEEEAVIGVPPFGSGDSSSPDPRPNMLRMEKKNLTGKETREELDTTKGVEKGLTTIVTPIKEGHNPGGGGNVSNKISGTQDHVRPTRP